MNHQIALGLQQQIMHQVSALQNFSLFVEKTKEEFALAAKSENLGT
ncbi:hypothetical protein NUACC26_012920 [Scytonema sp. NUACC26]